MSTTMEETAATQTEVVKNSLHIPDETGDTRIMWDPRDRDEVSAAKAAFDAAKKKGMIAYSVDANGEANTGEVIREFDPQAGKIIMARQTAGG